MKYKRNLTLHDVVIFEIYSSIWASYMPFGHEWISKYYAWKAKRKYKRYIRMTNDFTKYTTK